MWEYNYIAANVPSPELYHHGIQGQKWGVRRYQNDDGSYTSAGREHYGIGKKKERQARAINSMYNHANKWNRFAEKMYGRKAHKVAVLKEMERQNEEARKQKLSELDKIETKKELKKSRNQDRMDVIFGGQRAMKSNAANMTSMMSRYGEYKVQRHIRMNMWKTRDATLARMTPEEGYEYLRRKAIRSLAREETRRRGRRRARR